MEEGAVHYHNGLKAGDNTCDIYLIRALMRHIVEVRVVSGRCVHFKKTASAEW